VVALDHVPMNAKQDTPGGPVAPVGPTSTGGSTTAVTAIGIVATSIVLPSISQFAVITTRLLVSSTRIL